MAEMNELECLGADHLVGMILSFLGGAELTRMLMLSKSLSNMVCNDVRCWKDIVCSHGAVNIDDVLMNDLDECELRELMEAVRVKHAMEKVRRLRWTRGETADGVRMRGQEGHAMDVIHNRFVVLVNGYGGGIRNDVHVMDAWMWPVVSWMTTETRGLMIRKYGHSVTSIGGDRLLVFGGATSGGYMGDVNHLHYLDVCVQNTGTEELKSGDDSTEIDAVATYTAAAYTGVAPQRRAYHTATLIDVEGYVGVFVFGGISDSAAIADPQVLHVVDMKWENPICHGEQPEPRFGHTCVFHKHSNMLILAGGGNGSDLLRDGEEFPTVHTLQVTSFGGIISEFTWATPVLSGRVPRNSLGKCHNASLVGNNVIFFGGGSALSNKMCVLNIPSMRLFKPITFGSRPSECISSAAVRVGKYFFVFGGWRGRELKQMHLLDLSYETSDRYLKRSREEHTELERAGAALLRESDSDAEGTDFSDDTGENSSVMSGPTDRNFNGLSIQAIVGFLMGVGHSHA